MLYSLGSPENETYESAAILFTLLAYPHYQKDDHRTGRIHIALCHRFLRENSGGGIDWLTEVGAKSVYLFPTFDPDVELRQLQRKLLERMHAARIGISFLQELELGHTPKLPKAMKRLSLNEWANVDIAADQLAGGKETGNLETRCWRPSLPVLHLAIAVQKQLAITELVGFKLNLWHFFHYEDLLRNVVEDAENIAGNLKKVTRYKWPYEKRVQTLMGVGSKET